MSNITNIDAQNFLIDIENRSTVQILEEGAEKDELIESAKKRGILVKDSKDLGVIKTIYAFTDKANANGAILPRKEFKKKLPGLVGKLMDVGHNRTHIVGYYIDYKYIVKEDKAIAYAIFFKSAFPDLWEKAKEFSKENKLSSSFEIWAPEDKKKYTADGNYELHDYEIAGGGLIYETDKNQPAFKDAKVLQIAHKCIGNDVLHTAQKYGNDNIITSKGEQKMTAKFDREKIEQLSDSAKFELAMNIYYSENQFTCECLDCGEKVKTNKHCSDISCPKCGGEMRRAERPGPGNRSEEAAEWTTKYINDLPDSSFAVIEPAYKEGDTENKNARHLPFKNKEGEIDLPHYKNALARVNQIKPVTDSISTEELRSKAKAELKKHRDVLEEDESAEAQVCPNCGEEIDYSNMDRVKSYYKCYNCSVLLTKAGEQKYPEQDINMRMSCPTCSSRSWLIKARNENKAVMECLDCGDIYRVQFRKKKDEPVARSFNVLATRKVKCPQCSSDIYLAGFFKSSNSQDVKCDKCGIKFSYDKSEIEPVIVKNIQKIASGANKLNKSSEKGVSSMFIPKEVVEKVKKAEKEQEEAPKSDKGVELEGKASVEESEEKASETVKQLKSTLRRSAKRTVKARKTISELESELEEAKSKAELYASGIKKTVSKLISSMETAEELEDKVEEVKEFYQANARTAIERREELGEFASEMTDEEICDDETFEIAKIKKENKELREQVNREESSEVIGSRTEQPNDDGYDDKVRKDVDEKASRYLEQASDEEEL